MGKTKDAKVKERKNSASRNSLSSRPGFEQTVARVDPPGSTAEGHDDDAASVLSLSSSGGERVRGNTQVPGSRSSHGTPGLSPKGQRTHRSTPPDPKPVIWLVSMGFRLRPRTLRLRF